MDQHPGLQVDLGMDDNRQDLIGEGVDVALRFGTLEDSASIARRLGSAPRVLVCAPSYVERAGIPKMPSEIATHAVVVGPSGQNWSFRKDGAVTSIQVRDASSLEITRR
jgi:DNA-binding transcriptional LysR family regulator